MIVLERFKSCTAKYSHLHNEELHIRMEEPSALQTKETLLYEDFIKSNRYYQFGHVFSQSNGKYQFD